MRQVKLLFLFCVCTSLGCVNKKTAKQETLWEASDTRVIEVQGHRGDRGNFPENTVPAFLSAVKKGVDVLEMDVVITKDKQVVVSHEPYMASIFMLTPEGDSIPEAREASYNLYEMDYDSIKQFDSGSKSHKLFPDQQKLKTYKPLLSEVIDSVETFIAAKGLNPVKYSIELKSEAGEYNRTQPAPEDFINIVMEVIKHKGIKEKVIIQSFDREILNIMYCKYPEMEVAYLVQNEGIEENLNLLNFTPQIYSPNYKLVKDKKFVDSIKARKMKLIPWTVNEEKAIRKMMQLGVDGIISDYPERVLQKLQN